MTDPVFDCVDHDPFATATCPMCGSDGDPVLSGLRRRRLSTFLSGALRHFPDDAGLTLDEAGWAEWTAVVDTVDGRYDWAGEREVDAVVATDPKERFETRRGDDGGCVAVRAAYGHSVDVDLDADRNLDGEKPGGECDDLPVTLYHGTAPRNLDAIRAAGLKSMGRQQVHLSATHETARTVGERHAAEPVVLVVDARELSAAGFDVRKRGRNTYTVDRVPPRFLSHERL